MAVTPAGLARRQFVRVVAAVLRRASTDSLRAICATERSFPAADAARPRACARDELASRTAVAA